LSAAQIASFAVRSFSFVNECIARAALEEIAWQAILRIATLATVTRLCPPIGLQRDFLQPIEKLSWDTRSRELDSKAAPAGMAVPLKYHITKEEFAALDEETRGHYFEVGDFYRIKPAVTDKRQEKIALIVLFVLTMTFAVVGLYGYTIDSWQLQILAFLGAMPTLFGFLIHLSMMMSSIE
jgi:hypothetical protein